MRPRKRQPGVCGPCTRHTTHAHSPGPGADGSACAVDVLGRTTRPPNGSTATRPCSTSRTDPYVPHVHAHLPHAMCPCGVSGLTRTPAGHLRATQSDEDEHNEVCEVCDVGGHVICCESCNLVYHTHCLKPPLPVVPAAEWFCPQCLLEVGAQCEAVRLCSDPPLTTCWFGSGSAVKGRWRATTVAWTH